MSKILKRDLQPPFRQRDLLWTSNFIRYCRNYGIRTNERELEYFEKEQLLLPVVRVNRGWVPHKKIINFKDNDGSIKKEGFVYIDDVDKFEHEKMDPDIYYSPGGISSSSDNWMKYYEERDMILFPSRSKFRPWKSYHSKQNSYFIKDPQHEEYSTYYAPYQVYLLDFIKDRRRLIVSNEGLYRSPEEWAQAGKNISRMFNRNFDNNIIKQRALKEYTFWKFFNEVLDLRDEWEQDFREYLKKAYETVKEADEKNQLSDGDIDIVRQNVNEAHANKSNEILRRTDFNIERLEGWRSNILQLGSFAMTTDKPTALRNYLDFIPGHFLEKKEDPYRWASVLSWYINLVGGESKTLLEAIRGNNRYHRCSICGDSFIPKRKTQTKTCGADACQRAYNTKLVKSKREKGIYD